MGGGGLLQAAIRFSVMVRVVRPKALYHFTSQVSGQMGMQCCGFSTSSHCLSPGFPPTQVPSLTGREGKLPLSRGCRRRCDFFSTYNKQREDKGRQCMACGQVL